MDDIATLILTKTFVTLVGTGQSVSGQSARGRGEAYEAPGEVRLYAGGRARSITAAGVKGTYTFQLLLVPRTTVDTLYTWLGQLVQVRDHKGRKLLGVYYKLDVAEIVSRATWNVAVDLRLVTADEGI